jgi:phosphatidate cytidylyltransferase
MGEADKGSRVGNLAARFLTAGVAVPGILALLYLAPKWGFLVLVYAAAAVAISELAAMTLSGQRGQMAWAVLATLGLMTTMFFWSDGLAPVVAGVALGGLLVGLAAPEPAEAAGRRMAWLVAGPLYIGFPIACIGLLHLREGGGNWVILTMMLAWFGDTSAYFAGRGLGKHKLYPKVSPKKTVEGAIGGLLGSVGGALLAHFWYLAGELPLIDAIVLALVAGALGQAGDLVASLVKRSTGVKDSGWIVPGHGGILDRIDALMFTGTTTWLYVTLF